ncbi:host specificity factor TipJ family phage tail protein [Pseudomonas bubulae]|uniref:host specificity factor TipJ family phage tail protein n=1 Tax=Pseudomonas bubulae TaxID=2316085 RepID=UPI003CFFE5A7
MIRIYPSRLEGEPLESHVIASPMPFVDWLKSQAPEFDLDREHPICVEVNGVTLPVDQWASFMVLPETDLRIYPEARGVGAAVIAAWAAVAIAAVALVLVLSMKTPDNSQPGQGESIDTNPAKANRAKVNAPVREILGKDKVYPDYVVQPVSRFVNKREMHTTLCLCVGAGEHSILASSIKIGDTPLAAFGSDVSYTIYQPGSNLSGDRRAENWYSVGEVGGTDAGTSGLDTASTASGGSSVVADALVLAGLSVSLAGDSPEFPETWAVGTAVTLKAPNTYTVTSVGAYDQIGGPLGDLAPFVGMKVTLSTDADYDLVIVGYSPYIPPVAGSGGSPSSVLAAASPTTYDFSTAPVVWTVTYQGDSRTISLASDYVNMSGVVSAISSQLAGIGLTAQDSSGRLLIAEPYSPYKGGVLSQSNAPIALFGVGPVYTVGSASAGGVPEQAAYITLCYDSGEPFAGLDDGSQRMAIGYRGHRYQIIGLDALTMVVQRLNDAGVVDAAWAGFAARTLLDFALGSDDTGSLNWLGPFMATPEQELTDTVEYDFYIPSGLAWYKSNGHRRAGTVNIHVNWRDATIGGAWTSVVHTITESTEDGLGFTFSLSLPYRIRPQFRVRRAEPQEGGTTRDTVYWYGLRSKLATPAAYEGVTIFAAEIRTGDRLGAQSDRRVSMVPERLYDGGSGRSISHAALHVLDSLGIDRSEIDVAQLNALEAGYWTPRGETFDFSFTEQSTVREVLQTIFAAGMSHLTLTDSLISAIREGVQTFRGTITNHEMNTELNASFTAPGPDDFDGVDVKYVDPQTWSIETVRCRMPGSLGLKVETLDLDGVIDRDRAWRIGMRKLRKHLNQRWAYSGNTDLEALCYERLDHIVLADDIPGTSQSALIIDAQEVGGVVVLEVTEPLDWSVANPRILIRRHDGSATPLIAPTQLSEYTMSIPAGALDFDLITDLSIEPARLLFAASTQVGYSAMLSEIAPDSDGTCSFTAIEYRDDYYADDNGFAPN